MLAAGVFRSDVTHAHPRSARHFIYLQGEASAAAVASTLEREGWQTWVHASDDAWLVAASCLRVLSEQMAEDACRRLETLAAAHDGQYDGWETAEA
jgi:hypothetical protein